MVEVSPVAGFLQQLFVSKNLDLTSVHMRNCVRSRKETGSFVCKLLPLTYESTGLKQAELDSVLNQVKGWQEVSRILTNTPSLAFATADILDALCCTN